MPSRKIVADTNGAPFTYQWHYRSVIGKLNFLEKSTRPDISYAVHQLARYSTINDKRTDMPSSTLGDTSWVPETKVSSSAQNHLSHLHVMLMLTSVATGTQSHAKRTLTRHVSDLASLFSWQMPHCIGSQKCRQL
jgi:hypothetical protein